MDFESEQRYTGPVDSGPDWFAETLREVRRIRVGDVPITLESIGGGGSVTGLLEGVTALPEGEGGWAIELDVGGDRFQAVDCRDIAAFILHEPR